LQNLVSWGLDNSIGSEMSATTSAGTRTTTKKEEENNYTHTEQKDKDTGTSTRESAWSPVVSRKEKKDICTAN
jgi:hypothetical protein